MFTKTLFVVPIIALVCASAEPGELAAPVQVQAGGKPIDVERAGHSAPFFADMDGDGVRDLLVGQFDEGRLRIYRNEGTNEAPRFNAYSWFKQGAETGRVPVG